MYVPVSVCVCHSCWSYSSWVQGPCLDHIPSIKVVSRSLSRQSLRHVGKETKEVEWWEEGLPETYVRSHTVVFFSESCIISSDRQRIPIQVSRRTHTWVSNKSNSQRDLSDVKEISKCNSNVQSSHCCTHEDQSIGATTLYTVKNKVLIIVLKTTPKAFTEVKES